MTVDALKTEDKKSFAEWLKSKITKKSQQTSVPVLPKAKQQPPKPDRTKDELHREHLEKRRKQREKARRNRTEREAKSIGAKMIDDTHSIEDDLAAVNPNFNKGWEWQNNCQRCITAYEARRRGIDVEACSRDKDNGFAVLIKQNGTLNPDGYIASVYKNAILIKTTATTQKQCKSDIIKKMSEFGDGSRAAVRVRWQTGGGTCLLLNKLMVRRYLLTLRTATRMFHGIFQE